MCVGRLEAICSLIQRPTDAIGRDLPSDLERYLNFGLTMPEINDPKRPIIGIAQTGSDLSPCNRHHLVLAKRVRAGILAAGGTPMEFPVHPIQ